MSVDTILFALTKLERCVQLGASKLLEEKQDLLLSIGYLRDFLKSNDPVAFTRAIDRGLADQPDRYDFILGELYDIMGVSTRERFDELLACDWL